MDDVAELWRLVDECPERIPFAEGDRDGYHLDLLARAGKACRATPVLVEAVEYLLTSHALSGLLRPLVMTLARAIADGVRARGR